MNATETWYHDEILAPLLQTGEYLKIYYEPFRIRLAENSTYKPDFYILRKDGIIEIHETKGFWREDDRVKIKVAAEKFPEFIWKGITISGKKIKKIEEFG